MQVITSHIVKIVIVDLSVEYATYYRREKIIL